MKNLLFTLFIFLFIHPTVFAQAPAYEWVEKFGGPLLDDGQAITTDNAGNIYVAGNFRDTATFGSFTLTVIGGFFQDDDAFIAKMDSMGNVSWVHQIGGDGSQHISGIATDAQANIYVTGVFNNPITIGSTTLTPSAGIEWDFYIAKLDSSGSVLWAISEGDVDRDETYDIAVDGSGNVIVTGRIAGNVVIANTSLICEGQYDMFIAKYDTNGQPLWALNDGGSRSDYGYGVAVDDQDHIYVAGGFGSYGFPAVFGPDTLTPVGGLDAYLVKYDPSGNFQWVRHGGGDGNSGSGWGDKANSVTVTGNNVYITGLFWETAWFDNDSVTSNGMGEMFIAKYDLSGNLLWLTEDGGPNGDEGIYITSDDEGNTYTTGYFYDDAQYGDTVLANPGVLRFMYIIKYDSTGAYQWAKQAGIPVNANGSQGNQIATHNNRVYLTGYFQDSIWFDNQFYYSYGWVDAFVTCINQNPLPNAIQQIDHDVSFKVYPNPARNWFTVDFDDVSPDHATLEIRNELGQLYETRSIQKASSRYLFLTNNYPAGIYFVRFISQHSSHVKKVVVP